MLKIYLCGHSFAPIFALIMALISEKFFHGRGRWGYYDVDWMIWQYILNFVIFIQAIYWAWCFRKQYRGVLSVLYGFVALLFNPIIFNPFTEIILPGFRMGIWDLLAAIVLFVGVYLGNIKSDGTTEVCESTTCKIGDIVNKIAVKCSSNAEYRNGCSLKNIMSRLFSFNGCIGRLEYLSVAVVADVLIICIQIYFRVGMNELVIRSNGVMSTSEMVLVLSASLVLSVIKFAAITKRIHDLGKGGWWAFLACLMSRQIWIDIILIMFLGIKKGKSSFNGNNI